jgi:uncharacterized membrane protein YfcA
MTFLLVASVVVVVFSALLSMAGLGAAFLFVPFFYWMGVPLREAMATALLLNAISLAFASAVFIQGGLVRFRAALPILIAAVILSPLGAWSSQYVPRDTLLWLFAGFLVFAGAMMLFYRPAVKNPGGRGGAQEVALGAGVGGFAGYLGGLLGVGGGNFIVPVLTWLGYDAKVAAGTSSSLPWPGSSAMCHSGGSRRAFSRARVQARSSARSPARGWPDSSCPAPNLSG